MLDVWDQEISIGCEKLSLLVRACRHSGNAELANELEQGMKNKHLVTHNILCFKLQKSMLMKFEKNTGTNKSMTYLQKSNFDPTK